jgi:hypothetical protein
MMPMLPLEPKSLHYGNIAIAQRLSELGCGPPGFLRRWHIVVQKIVHRMIFEQQFAIEIHPGTRKRYTPLAFPTGSC